MPTLPDVFSAAAELKFLDGEPEGTLGGLGAVYGNIDSHRDLILHGAFADSIAEHKANGTRPQMFVEHSAFTGGDPLPIGVWDSITEEPQGLRVKGRLVGMSHPTVQRVADLLREKPPVLSGLSVAFVVAPGGAVFGKSAGEPRRTLKKLNLVAIDIVGDPSNPRARIDNMKSMMVQGDQAAAATAVAKAMMLHRMTLAGGNAPSNDQRLELLSHLQDAHHALTGTKMPPGMKAADTIRELEAWLHDPVDGLGWSVSKARAVAAAGFKAAVTPRDGDDEPADQETLAELKALGDFSLPSF